MKALLPFPPVLQNMASNLSWTSELGDAYNNQQADVMTPSRRCASRPKRRAPSKAMTRSRSPKKTTISPLMPQPPARSLHPGIRPLEGLRLSDRARPGWVEDARTVVDGPGLYFGVGFGLGPWWGCGWGWPFGASIGTIVALLRRQDRTLGTAPHFSTAITTIAAIRDLHGPLSVRSRIFARLRRPALRSRTTLRAGYSFWPLRGIQLWREYEKLLFSRPGRLRRRLSRRRLPRRRFRRGWGVVSTEAVAAGGTGKHRRDAAMACAVSKVTGSRENCEIA